MTSRTQHLEAVVMLKPTILDLITAKTPALQKIMDGFGGKLDFRVLRGVDDAIIDVLRTIEN
jgi:hypothetical protein